MGSAVWRGDQIHSDYRFTLGSKEFRLASEVAVSQLPNSNSEVPSAPEDPPEAPSANKFVPLTSYIVPNIISKKTVGPL